MQMAAQDVAHPTAPTGERMWPTILSATGDGFKKSVQMRLKLLDGTCLNYMIRQHVVNIDEPKEATTTYVQPEARRKFLQWSCRIALHAGAPAKIARIKLGPLPEVRRALAENRPVQQPKHGHVPARSQWSQIEIE